MDAGSITAVVESPERARDASSNSALLGK